MSIERDRVKEALQKYLEKRNKTLVGFGKYEKKQISPGTGLLIIETEVEEWSQKSYALVTTSRAHPQGIIFLNSKQIAAAMTMLIDGLDKDF